MKTIIIQIGNTDDKLTQERWSYYANCVDSIIKKYSKIIYFSGVSDNWKSWQNACWVFQCENTNYENIILEELKTARLSFNQDSIAWIEGFTKFI